MANINWAAVEQEAANLLSRYIQFDTTNPPGNELAAVEFLAGILTRHGFRPQLIRSAPGRANLVARLPAAGHPAAAPCLLYTHADVVPASPAGWSTPPFGGRIKDGYVWGRGALDNKGVGIIFLQTLILLKQTAAALNRDVILLVAADEEASGRYGAAWMLNHHPDLLAAEYVWDEGGIGLHRPAAPTPYLYQIAVAEKGNMIVKLVAHGTPGHAAVPHHNNPQDRLVRALARLKVWAGAPRLTRVVVQMLHTLAASQSFPRSVLYANAHRPWLWPMLRGLLLHDPLFGPLVRNTASLTMLRGGQNSNVIPSQAEARLDIRLLPGEDPQAVLAALRSLIADPQVTVTAEEMPVAHPPSPADSEFFRALARTLQTTGPPGPVMASLTAGATDSRYFRRAGMKAYGFVPMLLDITELGRIHGVDERVSTANLRWGIQVVLKTLQQLCTAGVQI